MPAQKHDVVFDVGYPNQPSTSAYRLLELPPDLAILLADADESSGPLTINGRPNDEAVLCTSKHTYALRQVSHSNTMMLLSPNSMDRTKLELRGEFASILEAVKVTPRLDRLDSLLRGSTIRSNQITEDEESNAPPNKRVKFAHKHLASVIQASPEELAAGLRAKHIPFVGGEYRPLSPQYLASLLKWTLACLGCLTSPHSRSSFPAETLLETLVSDFEVPKEIATCITDWFTSQHPEYEHLRCLNEVATARVLGISILSGHHEPTSLRKFMDQWMELSGDILGSQISLELLKAQYMLHSSTSMQGDLISYFPLTSLPAEATARFQVLFSVRNKWKASDLEVFLEDLGSRKDVERYLLKYTRTSREADARAPKNAPVVITYLTARNLW